MGDKIPGPRSGGDTGGGIFKNIGGGSFLGGIGDILAPQGGFAQTSGGKKLFRQGIGTGFSSAIKGQVILDPSIRALQEERLASLRSNFGTFRDNQAGLRSRFEGNRGALIEARTRPTTELVNRNLQGLQRRGLGGSSFQQQAATSGATAIGDARAQGEFETLEAISGIDKNVISAAFNFASQLGEVGSARLKQELEALGLGLEQVQQIIDSFEAGENRKVKERRNITQAIEGGFSSAGAVKGGGGGGL